MSQQSTRKPRLHAQMDSTQTGVHGSKRTKKELRTPALQGHQLRNQTAEGMSENPGQGKRQEDTVRAQFLIAEAILKQIGSVHLKSMLPLSVNIMRAINKLKGIPEQEKQQIRSMFDPDKGFQLDSYLKNYFRFTMAFNKKQNSKWCFNPNGPLLKYFFQQIFRPDKNTCKWKLYSNKAIQYFVGTPGSSKSWSLYLLKTVTDLRVPYCIRNAGNISSEVFRENESIKILLFYANFSIEEYEETFLRELKKDFPGHQNLRTLEKRITQRRFEDKQKLLKQQQILKYLSAYSVIVWECYNKADICIVSIFDQMNFLYKSQSGTHLAKCIRVIHKKFNSVCYFVSSKSNLQMQSDDPVSLQVDFIRQQNLHLNAKVVDDCWKQIKQRIRYAAFNLLFELRRAGLSQSQAVQVLKQLKKVPITTPQILKLQLQGISCKSQISQIVQKTKNSLASHHFEIKRLFHNLDQFNDKKISNLPKCYVQKTENELGVVEYELVDRQKGSRQKVQSNVAIQILKKYQSEYFVVSDPQADPEDKQKNKQIISSEHLRELIEAELHILNHLAFFVLFAKKQKFKVKVKIGSSQISLYSNILYIQSDEEQKFRPNMLKIATPKINFFSSINFEQKQIVFTSINPELLQKCLIQPFSSKSQCMLETLKLMNPEHGTLLHKIQSFVFQKSVRRVFSLQKFYQKKYPLKEVFVQLQIKDYFKFKINYFSKILMIIKDWNHINWKQQSQNTNLRYKKSETSFSRTVDQAFGNQNSIQARILKMDKHLTLEENLDSLVCNILSKNCFFDTENSNNAFDFLFTNKSGEDIELIFCDATISKESKTIKKKIQSFSELFQSQQKSNSKDDKFLQKTTSIRALMTLLKKKARKECNIKVTFVILNYNGKEVKQEKGFEACENFEGVFMRTIDCFVVSADHFALKNEEGRNIFTNFRELRQR